MENEQEKAHIIESNNTNIHHSEGLEKSRVATQGERIENFILDHICLFIFSFLVGILLAIVGIKINSENNPFFGLLVVLIYYVMFETIWQKTPGKWVSKTKVVTIDGKVPTFGQILGRTLARFIPFEPFSFLGSSKAPVGWHDKLSKTLVVPDSSTEDDVKKIVFEN